VPTLLHVVCDSNFYRGTGTDLVSDIVAHEARLGVVPLASFWPPVELLAHCATPDDPAHRSALLAVQRLRLHTGYQQGGSLRLRMALDGESLVAHGLFNGEFSNRLLDIANLTEVLIAASPSGDWTSSQRDALLSLATKVSRREQAFAAAMEQLSAGLQDAVTLGHASTLAEARRSFLDVTADPAALLLIAGTLAAMCAKQAGYTASEATIATKAPMLLAGFPTTVHFVLGQVRKGLTSEVNWRVNPHCNSVWDTLISFHVSSSVTTHGLPLLLVSSDREIRAAAKAAGVGEFAICGDRYCELVKSGEIVSYAASLAATAA
jgi:hypothetical protein